MPGSAEGAAGGRRGREEPGAESSAVSCAVGEGAAAGDAPRCCAADVKEEERPLPRQPRTMAAPGKCRGEAAGLHRPVVLRGGPAVPRRAGALRGLPRCRQPERGGALPAPPAGRCRCAALRAPGAPLLGKGQEGSALRVQGALALCRATVAPLLVAGLQRFLVGLASLVWSSGQPQAELS